MTTAVYTPSDSPGHFGYQYEYRTSVLALKDNSAHANHELDTKEFTKICEEILNGDLRSSAYKFSCLVHNLSNSVPQELQFCVYNALNSVTTKLSERVRRDIENDTFTLGGFSSQYDQYINNLGSLTDNLKSFLRRLQSFSLNDRQYNVLTHYGKILFYTNVINKTYNYNGEPVMFYAYINALITNKRHGLEDLQKILSIHRYYTNLRLDSQERKQYFNVKADEEFMSQLSSSGSFVCELVQFMHERLKIFHQKNVTKSHDTQTISKSELEEYARLVAWFTDPSTFMSYYSRYLSIRLLSPTETDNALELHLLKLMSNQGKDDPSYRRMELMMNDMELGKMISATYKQAKKTIRSEKFKPIADQFDTEKADVRFLTADNWSALPDTLDSANIKPPLECEAYILTFEVLYLKNLYMNQSLKKSQREISWNHTLSVGVVDIVLDGHKEPLSVLAYMPTIYILMCFNNKDQWSPKELAEELQFPLEKIGPYIAFLSNANVLKIVKSEGDNDVDMTIELNHGYNPKDGYKLNILIDPVIEKAHDENHNGPNNDEVMKILKEIFKFVNDSDEHISHTVLITKLNEIDLPFTLTDTHVKKAIERATAEGLIETKETANGKEYTIKLDSDDESDDEAEAEAEAEADSV
jgi:hypothetical protein